MRAMVYRRHGGPEVLELVELPSPKMSQTDVLVRTMAAAVNPADVALQAGAGDAFTVTFFPVTPGWDVAGIVEAVGAGVSELSPGDEVIGYVRSDVLHRGAYAEKVAAPAEVFVRKPRRASWQEAAALPLAGLTAHRLVIHAAKVARGETVLVLGAAGGVGALAAQLARLGGARVLGSASARHHAYLRALAFEPVDRGAALVESVRALAPRGVDVVIDCAGGGAVAAHHELTREGARVFSIADGGPGITTVFARADPHALRELAAWVEAGDLHVAVAATYPLEEAAQAQAALRDRRGGPPGKIVLTMARRATAAA